jgi:hypothetical protein
MTDDNIKLLIQEYNEQPIVGEGGLNSGIPIKAPSSKAQVAGLFYKDYKTKEKNPSSARKRYDILNTNAQRTYRNRYRDDYNEQMRKLYQKKYSASAKDTDAKENRMERMRWINANQRYKDNIYKLQNSSAEVLKVMPKVRKVIKTDFDNAVEKIRFTHKQKKTFIKQYGEEIGAEKYEQHLQEKKKERQDKINSLKEKFFNDPTNIDNARRIALDYEKGNYEKFKGEYRASNGEFNLSDRKEFSIDSDGRRKKLDGSAFSYAEPDYSQLPLKDNTVSKLENYYDDVIANKEGRNLNNEYQLHTPDGRKYKTKSKVKDLLEIHRNQLTAGEWKLDGTNPKRKVRNAKVVKSSTTEKMNDRGAKVKVKTSEPKKSDNPFTPQI